MSCEKFLEDFYQCCEKRGREDVELLPVSKGHPSSHVRTVLEANKKLPKRVGENYLQEMQQKAEELKYLNLEWHFIGNIQSRKLKDIANTATTIHSIGRVKELKIISSLDSIPKFYLQFNVSGENSKGGFELKEGSGVFEKLEELQLVDKCLGLMCSAAQIEDVGEQEVASQFSSLRKLRDKCFKGKALNMGMSSDYDIAINEGSNLVRVGSLVFGARKYQ